MSKHNFKELLIWQKSIDFAVQIYKETASFPKEEMFGLTSQIRHAAVSMASNIAEGCGRNHEKELIQFLGITQGSSNEVETQLIIANKIDMLGQNSFDKLIQNINEIQKMNAAFQRHLVK